MPSWAGVIGRARRSDVKAFTDRGDLIIAVGYDPIEINYEEWVGKTPIVHIGTEAAESGTGLNFIWNEACDLDAAIEAMGAIAPVANEWSPEELRRHRSSLEQALRPGVAEFSAHHVLDALTRLAPGRGHSGLRCRRAHASDRQPMAHGFAAYLARYKRLVVDGLRHAGGLRRRNWFFLTVQ